MAASAWVLRHGETSWSRSGRHTGRTDVDLTRAGIAQAERARSLLAGAHFDRIVCSPLGRARRTAELAGLVPFETDDDLREWDYGELEGMTTPEIQARFPGWSIWEGPWPGGESAADVSARADRVIAAVRSRGDATVALVGHGHFSRVLAARWVGEPIAVGRWLYLGTGSVSVLGWDRDAAVVRRWNQEPSG